MTKKKTKLKKPIFNTKEKVILLAIGKYRRFLSTSEIAKETGISWITCKKYIDKLYNEGIIARQYPHTGKRTYEKKPKFRLNFEEIYGK